MDWIKEIVQLAEEYNQQPPELAHIHQIPLGLQLASWIDHTQLKPEATPDQIAKLCAEACEYGFAAVCVNSANVPLASRLLRDSGVLTCATVGFPLGAMLASVKAFEAKASLDSGAKEIDMVLNIGALKAGQYEIVSADIEGVIDVVHSQGRLIKVILETALLTKKEKIIACLISKRAGADFVKTSTGFGPGGATEEDVNLMARIAGRDMQVKASGGIRNLKAARAMIAAGASRLGVSAGVEIMQEAKDDLGYSP